jgi:hypothetical protein
MEQSKDFIKVLKPLYFDATKLPEVAYHITDVEPDFGGHVTLRETVDSSENVYLKGHPFADIWVIKSTDPDATFGTNHEVHKLGEGIFCFFKHICAFTSISIVHKGPYDIHYYSVPDNIRSALRTMTFNFFINNDLYIYKNGMIGNVENPITSTLQGNYNHQYTKGTTKSTFVYSRTIQDLQSHPEMKDYAVGWDKTLIRYSNPPCIGVSINASEEAESKFQEFAKKVCPDVKCQFLNIDSIEVERPKEEKDRECQEDLNNQMKQVQLLIDNKILSYNLPVPT